jgi:hypothetical protein
MNHDALEAGMFWAGALMALTPLVFAGVVIGVWWFRSVCFSRLVLALI